MHSNIGLMDAQRAEVGQILTVLLADEYLLYTKTRNYHWNVVGPQFIALHKFFEAQYEALQTIVDDVAERIRVLGHAAIGTLAECLEQTRLQQHPGHYPAADEMLMNLLSDHESVMRQLRTDVETCMDPYHDAGTSDFLTGLLEQHEKMAWMLRASLPGATVEAVFPFRRAAVSMTSAHTGVVS
jgi:starvation-inducible DNA-binding protein